jgi:vancomycin resistance protein YoaR
VDWQTLRTLNQSGSYDLPAGNTWSFNETFGGGLGYKMASGVLAGGHCALATVFRAAVIQAGLPNQAIPHHWPIPGFPLDETVTIWWGRDDLLVHNTIGLDVSLNWDLSPDGIKISILSFNVD